ncbi:hypothetical protein CAPTEDRAFT_226996 [Capitella teleta]|uniref:Uncharacterized protein n=1 Tax=Capitella teleta TaxID=283909 RepID=R7VG08_CAPTE|nr:hypothetical protein CAPTEDRAFT_226996 [Capitella teleta]|eukprot:ELU14615.1 hypothetical protein CAPTEDRAFT_226996 [Capitella teleta]
MKRLKQAYMQERVDQVARSRKLHADTIKRRRALANKKKTDAHKEEQRRQAILAQRKEQIREATEKYQRQNKHYDARDYHESSPSGPMLSSGPNLEEALRAIRGPSPKRAFHRSNSVERQKGVYSSSSLRQGSASSLRQGSSSSLRSNASGTYCMQPDRYNSNSVATNEHQRPEFKNRAVDPSKASPQTVTQLQHRSHNNLNTSRSLFEQQLEQQQNLLQEQQQQYLQEFNRAIKQEMERDVNLAGERETSNTYHLQRQRSDSISSADSLEVERETGKRPITNGVHDQAEEAQFNHHLGSRESAKVQGHEVANTAPPVVVASSASAVNSFVIHRSVNVCSPNVAVVQPSVVSSASSQLAQPLQPKPNAPYNVYGYTESSVHANCSPQKTDLIMTTSAYGNMQQDAIVSNMSIQATQGGRLVFEFPSAKGDASNAYDPRTQDVLSHRPSAPRAWTTSSPSVTQPSSNTKPSNPKQSTGSTVAQVASERPAFVNPVANHIQNLQNNSFIRGNRSTAYASATSVTPQSAKTESPYQPPPHTEPVAPPSNHLYQVVPTPSLQEKVSQNVAPPSKGALIPVEAHPFPQDPDEDAASTLSSSSSDVENESHPETPAVKGILKKRYGPIGGKTPRGSVRLLVHGTGKEPLSRGSIRDSIEVNRDLIQRSVERGSKKKSVRFAQKLCEEQEESTSSYRQIHFTVPSGQSNTTNTVTTAQDSESSKKTPPHPPPKKPSRPTSAQTTSSTPKVDPAVKNPRVVSAGRMRRGPFLRPHPPAQPRSGRANMNQQNGHYANKVPLRYYSSNVVTATASADAPAPPLEHSGISVSINTPGVESEQQQDQSNLDPNGIQLDRTPTDDEINCLWDNVRNCLAKEESQEGVKSNGQMSQQCIDGNTITSQSRSSTRASNSYANNYMGSAYPPKKKFSMDALNNFNRRNSLLYGRKNPLNNSNAQQPKAEPSQATIHDLAQQQQQPKQSAAYPSNANSVYGPDVSGSMAAFLTAEVLAQRSASESQIEAAMAEAQMRQQSHNAMHSQPMGNWPLAFGSLTFMNAFTGPSALSLEEQRLMQSLERLNERLRVAETSTVPSTPAVPKPPSYVGFKGHAPLSNTSKRHVNSNGTVSRYNYRYAQPTSNSQLQM